MYFSQNAKLLEVEKLHLLLSVDLGQSLVGLHDILSPHARNLKVLDFTVSLYDEFLDLLLPLPLSGLCNKLEAIVGHNIMEALSFEIDVDGYVKPGWSAFPLRSQSHVVRD